MSTTAVKTIPIATPRQTERGGGDHLARAVALHLAGKRDEALQQFQKAIAAKDASPEIFRAMGHIQFEMANYEDAAKTYRKLTQLKPQYAMGWFNLAVSLERLSAWDEASEAFHKAGTLDPKHGEAHLGLGVCHLRLEDPKSALYSFDRCLELLPEHEDAAFGKAAALQSLGHADDAAGIYEKILT